MSLQYPIRIVVLEGSGYEIGYQHGRLLGKEIADQVRQTMGDSAKSLGLNMEKMRRNAEDVGKTLPLPIAEEIRGVADGAGQSYHDILCLNTFLDVAHCLNEGLAHCVSFAVKSSGTADGHFYYGRNLDFRFARFFSRNSALFVRKSGDGRRFATISIHVSAHIAFLTALTENGMVCSSVSSHCHRSGNIGIPAGLVARYVLERSSTLDEVLTGLTGADPVFAFNFLLADGTKDRIVEVEYSPDGTTVGEVHDTWGSIGGLRKNREFSRNLMVYSVDVARQIRTSQLLSAAVPGFSREKGLEILRDRLNLLERDGGGGQASICNASTIHSMLADFTSGEVWLTVGPPPAPLRTYQRLELAELFSLPAGLYLHDSGINKMLADV